LLSGLVELADIGVVHEDADEQVFHVPSHLSPPYVVERAAVFRLGLLPPLHDRVARDCERRPQVGVELPDVVRCDRRPEVAAGYRENPLPDLLLDRRLGGVQPVKLGPCSVSVSVASVAAG
ncbi:hypothetical protein ACEPTV_33515, partial [Burkholderia pseudomallei]|uniref:hypothetical protein n=1 Tax=Burkholderia pseudomallei TaxID=28450 RepID=UPI00358E5541